MRRRGAQQLVDNDTVVHLEASLLGELHVGACTHAHQHEVSGETAAVRRVDSGHAAGHTDDPADRGRQLDLETACPVSLQKERSSVARQDTAHELVGDLDDRRVLPQLHCGRCDLHADEAASDDHHARSLFQANFHLVGFIQGAQRQHTLEVGALQPEQPVPRAGRKHKIVVFQDFAVLKQDPATVGIQMLGACAGTHLDALLPEPRLRPQPQGVTRGLAGQVALGQRRSLVGQVSLCTNEDDAAREALLTQ